MQYAEATNQRQKLLVGQAAQADNGSCAVFTVGRGKACVRQATPQCLIAEQSTSGILQKLRRAAEEEGHACRPSLHGIVEHGQDHFIVLFPGNMGGYFIKVHALVNEYGKARIACLPCEHRPELEIIVPVVVVDHPADLQILPRLCAILIFPAKPTERGALQLGIILAQSAVPRGDRRGKIKAAHAVLQGVEHGVDLLLHLLAHLHTSRLRPPLTYITLQKGDPAGQDNGQCAAVRTSLHRHVADQLPIGRQTRAGARAQAAFGRKIAVRGHKALLVCIITDELEQKALAASVFADEEAHRGAAL